VGESTDARGTGPSIAQLARVRAEIMAAAARHGATNVRVFGSVARGDADAASDIDFLVDFEPGRSLLDLAGLLVDLEDLLGHPVDVVTEPGLKARIRQRILAEAVAV
jgi:predicted nucleotidyltransferase